MLSVGSGMLSVLANGFYYLVIVWPAVHPPPYQQEYFFLSCGGVFFWTYILNATALLQLFCVYRVEETPLQFGLVARDAMFFSFGYTTLFWAPQQLAVQRYYEGSWGIEKMWEESIFIFWFSMAFYWAAWRTRIIDRLIIDLYEHIGQHLIEID
jgi:hypothetical protein